MTGFTKIFSSMLDSTIWAEPWHIKGVWITMLVMADKYGNVHASVPGLAKRATVSIEECEEALRKFQQPDQYSRTTDYDGRRIEAMEGGWHLLNYLRYREMRDEDARREQNRIAQQKRRSSAKNDDSQQKMMTVSKDCLLYATVSHCQPLSAQAEAEAEAEAEKESTPPTPQGGSQGEEARGRSRAKRRSRDEITEPYPEQVRKVVNAALRPDFWPKEDPRDHRAITVDVARLCSNVAAIIAAHPSIEPEDLILGMESYVHKPKERYCAPQFFFGSKERDGSDPHWLAEYRMIRHRKMQREAAQQPQQQAPAPRDGQPWREGVAGPLNAENHSQQGDAR